MTAPEDNLELPVDNVELPALSCATVYDASRRGQIPHRKVGRRLLFERGSIVQWLRNTSVTPSQRRGDSWQ